MVVEAGIPDRAVSVLYRGGAEVDVRRGELLDERTQGVGLREPRDLVTELEVLENVLYVGREAVEVGLEVGPELLPARAGPEVAQGELRGVVEGLSRRLPEGRVLLDDAGLVEHRLHLEHVRLAIHQHRVQPAQHRHRQDDVPVLAADVEVSEDVVGDPPDIVRDPVQVAVTHMRMIGPWRPRRDTSARIFVTDVMSVCLARRTASSSMRWVNFVPAAAHGTSSLRGFPSHRPHVTRRQRYTSQTLIGPQLRFCHLPTYVGWAYWAARLPHSAHRGFRHVGVTATKISSARSMAIPRTYSCVTPRSFLSIDVKRTGTSG